MFRLPYLKATIKTWEASVTFLDLLGYSKIADIQAHSAALSAVLWACRSAIFEKVCRAESPSKYAFSFYCSSIISTNCSHKCLSDPDVNIVLVLLYVTGLSGADTVTTPTVKTVPAALSDGNLTIVICWVSVSGFYFSFLYGSQQVDNLTIK